MLSKVIERVVHTQLSIHLDQLGYLYKYQYVFRRGHSTQQAIAQFNDWVLEAMDRGKVTGLLFVDISKAFDSLNHKVLLGKLESLRSYLARRRQRVLIIGELPRCRVITHGIPQESIWALCYLTFMLIACQMKLKTLGSFCMLMTQY